MSIKNRQSRMTMRNRIADAIAFQWLTDAEEILATGKTPVKLSQQHRMLVQEYAESHCIDLDAWEVADTARKAVRTARHIVLCSDRFPAVKRWVLKSIQP